MGKRFSRRAFVKLTAAASGAFIVGFDPRVRSWVTEAHAQQRSPEKLPTLDGVLLFDDAPRKAVSVDVGRNFQRLPLAVLKPGSVQDVVKMVQYAKQHHLKIAMRGQGHSQYGQTLVEAGIVIDSSTLNAVRLAGAESVDAQAGASWGEVNQVTLTKGLTPPAMGDTMTLSVGGILSVGGFSNSSHHFGGVVDTVQELDVVTGDGRLVTCSPRQNSELFKMVLAGLGQCALIVRARVRLVPAPSHVVRQDLIYHDLETYISDAERLALDGRFDHLDARVVQEPSGGWRFRMNVGKFYTLPQEPDLAALADGLRFTSKSEPEQVSYWDYLQRAAAFNAAFRAADERAPQRSASIVMFVPASAARDFAAGILATPSESAGLWLFGFPPLNLRLFTRPLFKLPNADVAFSLWLFRFIPLNDTAAYAATMETNNKILERMRAVGGKPYPPFTPYFSRAEWEDHYGPETWRRLAAAKERFDPNNVLTPGPGIFAAKAAIGN